MPPDPPKWCAVAHYSITPSNFLYVAFCPPLVIFSKRNPETGPHPQLFPYSQLHAWSHSTPQTLTSTSKQILHYNKHLYHSCWYLKGTVYKAVASCENCETISGDYKSAMAQVTCTMEYGICTLGKTYCCPRVQIPYN